MRNRVQTFGGALASGWEAFTKVVKESRENGSEK